MNATGSGWKDSNVIFESHWTVLFPRKCSPGCSLCSALWDVRLALCWINSFSFKCISRRVSVSKINNNVNNTLVLFHCFLLELLDKSQNKALSEA